MNRIKIVSMLLCVGIPTASALLGGCATTPQATVQVAPPPPPPPQPMPQPVQTGPAVVTGVSTGVMATSGGGVGSLVNQAWTATGYSVGDFVSNHMTLRARQFANGFMAVTDLVRATMRHGERRTVSAAVVGGHCYRIIGVGGAGVGDLDLYLRDMGGTLVDQDRAPDNFPVIGLDRQLCIPPGLPQAPATLEIVMARGQGDIGVQVFGTP